MGKLFSLALDWGLSFVSGLTFKQWVWIIGVIASALLLWQAYSWSYGRGAAWQKGEDAELHEQDQAKIKILADNVLSLVDGVKAANDRIALEQAKRQRLEAEAASRARASLAVTADKRRKEATRGAGADAMNTFMRETFQ